MALWVFSGLFLRAVTGNHCCVFPFPVSSLKLLAFVCDFVMAYTSDLSHPPASDLSGTGTPHFPPWKQVVEMHAFETVIFWGLVLVYKGAGLNPRTSY